MHLASESLFRKSGMVPNPHQMYMPKIDGSAVDIRQRFLRRAPENETPTLLTPFAKSYTAARKETIDVKEIEDQTFIATFICVVHASEWTRNSSKKTSVELLIQDAYVYDYKIDGVLPVPSDMTVAHVPRDNTPPPTPAKTVKRMWSDLDD